MPKQSAEHRRPAAPKPPAPLRFERLIKTAGVPPEQLLNAFMTFDGRLSLPLRHLLDAKLRRFVADAGLEVTSPLLLTGALHPAVLERFVDPALGGYRTPEKTAGQTTLLPGGPNELAEPDFSARFRAAGGVDVTSTLRRRVRSPYLLLERPEADVAVMGDGFATLARDGQHYELALSARNFPVNRLATNPEELDGPLVICHDPQGCANFSHFLFDALPRMLMFLDARPELARSAHFMFGSVRKGIHDLILGPLLQMHGLEDRQLLFVGGRRLLRPAGPVFGFSDAVISRAHPMNIGHPELHRLTRKFLSRLKLPTEEGVSRVYVTRRDAGKRRVANEAELQPLLDARGFRSVALGELPLLQQVALMRGARVMLGPHGMGFAHVIFHDGQPRVLEIFHPGAGTTAYRCMARAAGGHHAFLVGKLVQGGRADFTVTPEELDAFLAAQLDA